MDKTENTSRRSKTARSARATHSARAARNARASEAAARRRRAADDSSGRRSETGSDSIRNVRAVSGNRETRRAAGNRPRSSGRSAGSTDGRRTRSAGTADSRRTRSTETADSRRSRSARSTNGHSTRSVRSADGRSTRSARPANGHSTRSARPTNGHNTRSTGRTDAHRVSAAGILLSVGSAIGSGVKAVINRLGVFLTPSVLVPAAVKWTAFILIGLTLMSQLRVKASSETSFDAMSKVVTAAADLTNTNQGDNQMVRRLYGLTPSDFSGVLLYCPKTNMGAEELLLVRLGDPSQEESVLAAMAKRLETQLASFDGYGVDQTEMLEKSITISEGGYCFFYSGNDPQKVRNAFRDAL